MVRGDIRPSGIIFLQSKHKIDHFLQSHLDLKSHDFEVIMKLVFLTDSALSNLQLVMDSINVSFLTIPPPGA